MNEKIIQELALKIANLELANTQLTVMNLELQEQLQAKENGVDTHVAD